MKRLLTLLTTILLVLTGCGGGKPSADDLITVDVTASYPKKELILQDFMDVEYIPLETTDEFITQGFVQSIGKDLIVVRNFAGDGDIFIFDRITGKAIRKINRKGQGGEEYINILGITLDEENEEMFVNDLFSKKILIYDLYGNYKRSLKHKEGSGYMGASLYYTEIFNYDKDHLIGHAPYNEEIPFALISKQDGSTVKDIRIPFKEKRAAIAIKKDDASGMTYSVSPGPYRPIAPYNGNWILLELSSDTVYTFLPDYSLRPFAVRTPPVQSMNPEVFLVLRLLSDRYYFMETIKNEYDWDSRDGFPRTFMMYDRQEKEFFRYTVYNGDFSTPKEIYMNVLRPVDHEIESWQLLQAPDLVIAYEKGQLKGRLKEIAATLDEESNPVIMLIKHKN